MGKFVYFAFVFGRVLSHITLLTLCFLKTIIWEILFILKRITLKCPRRRTIDNTLLTCLILIQSNSSHPCLPTSPVPLRNIGHNLLNRRPLLICSLFNRRPQSKSLCLISIVVTSGAWISISLLLLLLLLAIADINELIIALEVPKDTELAISFVYLSSFWEIFSTFYA